MGMETCHHKVEGAGSTFEAGCFKLFRIVSHLAETSLAARQSVEPPGFTLPKNVAFFKTKSWHSRF